MPVPILAARYVHKTYGRGANRFDALRGVSLDIDEGDSIAVVGKSGSGKSTLMHLLALLDEPTEGTVELSGRNAAALPGAVLNQTRNDTFGFVFQQFFLTPNASVLSNVTLPLRIAGHWLVNRTASAAENLAQVQDAIELNRRLPGPWLRITGIKILVDGVIDSCTAAMKDPYADGSHPGPIWDLEALAPVVAAADAAIPRSGT